MSHRYASCLFHCVFSTKNRKPLIKKEKSAALWAYIGGIARTKKFKALAVGGMEDHVHALLSLPATMPVSKAVQLVKGGSSKWLNDNAATRSFAWQDSYGAFSIGISQVQQTIRYINNQERHHAKSAMKKNSSRSLNVMGSRSEIQPSPAGTYGLVATLSRQ